MKDYDGHLLRLAVDLADRLVPAFDTKTGIPFGTVNLRHGVPKGAPLSCNCLLLALLALPLLDTITPTATTGETEIASTAGAGSLTLEFQLLSDMTGNATYAEVRDLCHCRACFVWACLFCWDEAAAHAVRWICFLHCGATGRQPCRICTVLAALQAGPGGQTHSRADWAVDGNNERCGLKL